MDRSGPEAWFKSLPPVSKYMMVAIFILTLLFTLELISPRILYFDSELVISKLQIWRALTNFLFIGNFSYNWIIHMYLWSQFSTKLEKNEIFTSSSSGSYLWFILFQMFCLDVLGILFYWPLGKPFLSNSLLSAVIFYWSRREPWEPITIYFIKVKGYQLPFALLFFQLIMGASLWDGLLGIISGQIYYYFNDIMPSEAGGRSIIPKCPAFLNNLMSQLDPPAQQQVPQRPQSQINTSWFSNLSETTVRRPTTSTFSGSGRRLGGN